MKIFLISAMIALITTTTSINAQTVQQTANHLEQRVKINNTHLNEGQYLKTKKALSDSLKKLSSENSSVDKQAKGKTKKAAAAESLPVKAITKLKKLVPYRGQRLHREYGDEIKQSSKFPPMPLEDRD